MKNCLIFPPKWSVAHPYLSTPCLKAYLNEHGIEIDQYDFNLEELEYFTSKPFLDICMNKILKKGISIESEEIYRLLYDYLIKNIDNFKNNVGSLDYFIELENYKKWKNLFQSYNSFVSTSFELFRTSLDYVNFGEEITINNIESIVKDRDINPYIDFAEYIIDKTDLLDFGFIGFSVVVPEQIVPVLTLCNYIKTLNSDIHICIGGSMFSKIYYKIENMEPLFKYFDSIILFEGEKTLLDLTTNLNKGISLENVPNLVYIKENIIIVNNIKKANIKIDSLPVPNFEGLKLESYISPETILPYNISRSCYWGKCTFCDHDFGLDGNFRIKSINKVIEDLTYLKTNYNVDNIHFIDEAIPPKYLEILCDKLIEINLGISWFTCIKASKNFTFDLGRKMKQAGCVMVNIGIESYSDKVLKDMDKGISLEDIQVTTDNLALNGIWVHAFLINNFPTEELEDKLKTILYVFNSNIHSVGLAEFLLSKNAKIIVNNLNLELESIEEKRDFSCILEFDIKGKDKNNTTDQISNIYSLKMHNVLYPTTFFLREHLLIFLKHYDLVINKAYLKLLTQDNVFDINNLLYKEFNGKTLIYNLKTNSAFSCEYNLNNILDNIEDIKSIKQIRQLIQANNAENFYEIEQMLNIIFS